MSCRPITSKQSLASLKEIDFAFIFVVLGCLATRTLFTAVGILVGGVGDGPLPPGCDTGVASHAASVDFFAAIVFNPSIICPDTSFCFASATVHAVCL